MCLHVRVLAGDEVPERGFNYTMECIYMYESTCS